MTKCIHFTVYVLIILFHTISFFATSAVDPSGTSPCLLPLDHGTCTSYVHKWYYNLSKRTCDVFVYGGCDGNANKFESQDACLHACQNFDPYTIKPTSIPTCDQELDAGYCENYQRVWYFNSKVQRCFLFIYNGCGGNQNRFATKDICESSCLKTEDTSKLIPPAAKAADKTFFALAPTPDPKDLVPEYCYQNPDYGSCSSYVYKWFYNPETHKCDTFVYSGCGGNENRFDAQVECQHFCINSSYILPLSILVKYGIISKKTATSKPEDICKLEQDTGHCTYYSEKWYFNHNRGRCETFTFGGCGGNQNQFGSEQECQNFCITKATLSPVSSEPPPPSSPSSSLLPCQQPLDHGYCESYVHKWYYNNETNRCNTFIYGGCGGNNNRFHSELLCWRACIDPNATWTDVKSTTVKPQIVHNKEDTTYYRARQLQNDSRLAQVRMDTCRLKPYYGSCKDQIFKWFYNVTAGECQIFLYGGCLGNGNRFDSQIECMHFCVGGTEYTLSPYLRQQYIDKIEEKWFDGQWPRIRPTAPTVPLYNRSEKLTFPDTGVEKTFMFARNNAFIQLDSTQIPNFQLRLCREISFEFRTKLPHGLLVYHGIKNRPEGLSPYALYIIVEKGQLKVVHVFGKHSTSVIVGEGLNRDTWHAVTVRIDVYKARLFAQVNNKSAEVDIKGLHHRVNYGVMTDLTSVVLIGGLSPEEKLHGVKYIIESFVGCIRDVVLKAGKAAMQLLPIKPLIASKHENVQEGCINRCRTRENLCFVGSRCVNHYNSITCDCFGTLYEGEHCDVYTATILTFRGSTYVSYRVYDWRDRVHSSENRISLFFKTRYDDSALFYASGETAGKHHHIAASIKNGSVVLDIDFGDGPVIASLGTKVNSNKWNNLTIYHRGPEIFVSLNNDAKLLDAPGDLHHLSIDPEIYIGGGPELSKKKGLVSHNNFAGSLKYLFYNDISILYELHRGNPKVHYIGVLDPEFTESDVEVIPITFPFPSAHIWWPNRLPALLNISFHFKSARSFGVLAYSEITTNHGHGFWQLRIVNDELRFELVADSMKNVTHVTTVKFLNTGWHTVELIYQNGEIKLTVDLKTKISQLTSFQLAGDFIQEMGDKIIIGSGDKKNAGFVGCMRLIRINGEQIEPRYAVRSIHAGGDVSLDNCQLVDPCKRPNACEHGGKCSVDIDKVVCDCVGTGYIGKNCHFAQFRKTCEELALLGYTKPDVYLIDIDGNGRFPPAHVKCEFPSTEDSTKTIVEHNLPSQVDVRSSSETDFSFSIKYREFTAEMLQELISHSLYCSQHIKYDCYKAPLDLHSATWFVSSSKNKTVDYIGDVKRGSCPCGMNRTCVNPMQSCNCDISEAKWHSDEGYYTIPYSLGITEMVFIQQKDLAADALGRITLGPLECVEANTQKYVVTFTTSQSYIEVPGWRKGDIAFSFRTTGEKAILLYQPPIRPNYPSFMVALTSDFQLTFNFTLNTGRSRELEIKSRRKLNGGEWQKIWIDYNEHHVRFMINTDYQMVDLLPEEEFGPFEGSMFIGGATEDLLKKSSVTQGLIGCFRGLVVNGEILDIYSYMSVHLSEIIKDCKPTCDPNPCKNGAMCRELWSKYECVCENPWAHVGEHCEENINVHALTFLRSETYLRKIYIRNIPEEKREALQTLASQNLLLNLRTYDKNALVLYINDNLNNFIQLYIHSGRYVVFLFNDGNQIKSLEVDYPEIVSGKSVQIAVIRTPGLTTLHVNEKNTSVASTHRAILTYSNRPWINAEKEVLAPQRPPAPPVEYYQVNLGGYDPLNLRKMTTISLPGYVGCIRGFKLGNYLADLESQLKSSNADEKGVIAGCRIKCDEQPCQHQGICTEDFVKGESTCDCVHTSYHGEFCNEEKGADFSGESQLQRQFMLQGTVHSVKVQLAFSSTDIRQKKVVLLLLQTDNRRSYYLLVAITPEGHLLFEEDREDVAFGAKITETNFLNGARHSVYYFRNGSDAALLIDRELVPLEPIPVPSISEYPEAVAVGGANELQIGGLNTTDPRFRSYQPYSGCLSNVLVEVNGYEMKPLEEYMAFIKTGSEKIGVQNSAGIRSAQCSIFDLSSKLRLGPSLNISLGKDKVWVEDPPARIAYKSLYSDSSQEEEGTERVVVIVLMVLFVIIILSVLYLLWRTDRRYRRQKELQKTVSQRVWRDRVSFTEPTVKTVTFKRPPGKRSEAERNLLGNEQTPIPEVSVLPNGNVKPDRENVYNQTIIEEEEATVANEKASEQTDENQNKEERVVANHSNNQKSLIFTRSKCPTIEEEMSSSEELMEVGLFKPGADQKIMQLLRDNNPGPVFLSLGLRNFSSPISYLGGSNINSSQENRTSKESLASLD